MRQHFKNTCILIPAFEPDENLKRFVEKLLIFGWREVVIVNDGSSQRTKQIFIQIRQLKGVKLLNHGENKGKGAALKTGMKYIRNLSGSIMGIITVDADGQHLVEDIVKIAQSIKGREEDFILGVRNFKGDIPIRSKFGNRVTQYLLSTLHGIAVEDTQTGLRYLPYSMLGSLVDLPGERYEYELECLFDAKKQGRNITQVPIQTVYIEDNRSSHFRPIMDSARIYMVFGRFSVSSLLCFGIDITIFTLMLTYTESVMTSTIVARVISGIINFSINKVFVFITLESNELAGEAMRYIVLWALLAFTSGTIVSILEGAPTYMIIPLKISVDLTLFVIAFVAQRYLVFQTVIRY